MYRNIAVHTMRSGKTAEIGVIEAPDATQTDRIVHLYSHKSLHWRQQLEMAFLDRCDSLQTRVYAALLDGELVASACCFERHGAGILSHVHTHEAHRRQGLCTAVLRALFEEFKDRGGWTMVLGTTFKGPAYWIYHQFGFRSLRGGFMQWEVPGREVTRQHWFAGGSPTLQEARWEHWPLVCHLAASPAALNLRHVGWQMADIGLLELEYLRTMLDVVAERASARVMTVPGGAVVGVATRCAHAYWHNASLVDVLYHPDHAAVVADLLGALDLSGHNCLAYADLNDHPKREALGRLGFRQAGQMQALAFADAHATEVAIYQRETRM